MRRFGKPQKPFYIVLSKDDKALWLSRTIGGGVTRVGDNPDTAELAALGATVIDLTDVKANDSSNHDKFDQLAAVAPQLRGVLAQGIAANPRATDLGGGATQGGLGAVVSLADHAARRADQDHRQSVTSTKLINCKSKWISPRATSSSAPRTQPASCATRMGGSDL